MPYRDDREALLARKMELERELHELEGKAAELAAIRGLEDDVRHQLADVRAMLERGAPLPSTARAALDDIQVASPCTADWAKMIGDERKRFCEACGQSVYNVEALTREEVAALVAQSDRLCVRLFRRTDGTLMTADCPVGKRRVRLKQIASVAAGGLLAGVAVTAICREVRPTPLHEIYTVEVSAQGHHHRLGAETSAAVHVSGSAPTTLDPPHVDVRVHTQKNPEPSHHVMGAMRPPSQGKRGHSCDYPTKATLL